MRAIAIPKNLNVGELKPNVIEIITFTLISLSYLCLVSIIYPSLALALLSFIPLWFYRLGLPWQSCLMIYFFPYIFSGKPDPMETYVIIGLSSIGGWILIKSLENNFEAAKRIVNPIFAVALSGAMVGSIILINAIRTHHNLMTAAWDLGLFDNIFYNISIGNGMFNPMERNNVDQNHFYVHFSPIFYILTPLYAIGQRAEALIAIQALTVTTSSLCLYALAKELINRNAAAILAICWSLYVPLLGGLYYHFHEVVVGPTILFLLGWSMIRGNKILPWVFIMLLASIKEDYPIICIPAVMLFSAWSKRIKLGVCLIIFLVIYFAAIKIFWIIPNAENWTGRIYGNLGVNNVVDLARLLIENPYKLIQAMWSELKLFNILELLVPLGFVALLSPWTYIMMAVPLLILYTPTDTVFSSNLFQYTFSTAPFLFLGTIDAIKKWNKAKQIRVSILLLFLGLLTQYNFGMLGGKPFKIGFIEITNPVEVTNADEYKELKTILLDIPKEKIVAGDDNLAPHISNRTKAYSLKYITPQVLESWEPTEKPDYIIRWKTNDFESFKNYSEIYIGSHFRVLEKMKGY